MPSVSHLWETVSMTFPEVQRADCYKVVATQGREGMQRQGKSSQEIIVTPWDRVLVPPQGIHITLFLSSLQTLISQQNGRCQHSSFQTSQFDKLKRLIRRPPEVTLLFSHQVVSDSSQPHGLQHARPPCPSLSPRVCPSSLHR